MTLSPCHNRDRKSCPRKGKGLMIDFPNRIFRHTSLEVQKADLRVARRKVGNASRHQQTGHRNKDLMRMAEC
jgi:hypothetical protein